MAINWSSVVGKLKGFFDDFNKGKYGGKFFGGNDPSSSGVNQVQQSIDIGMGKAVANTLSKAKSGDINAINFLKGQQKEEEEKEGDRLGKLKRFGGSFIGKGGLLQPGETISAGGIGKAVSGAGEVLPGGAGAAAQVVGAILQVAGKIDEWAKNQLQVNFAYAAASPSMMGIATRYEKGVAQREYEMGERLKDSASTLERSRSRSEREWMDTKAGWEITKNWAADQWNELSSNTGATFSALSYWLQGKSLEDRARDQWDTILKTETVDLIDWALDEQWVNAFGVPKDFGG